MFGGFICTLKNIFLKYHSKSCLVGTYKQKKPMLIYGEVKCISVFPAIARAVAYSEPGCCSDGLQSTKTSKNTDDLEDRRTPTGLDYVQRSVLVEV